MEGPSFWDNRREAQKIIDRGNNAKNKMETFLDLEKKHSDLWDLCLSLKEDYDQEMNNLLDIEELDLIADLEKFEIDCLLNGPYDANDAILTIHPGAGGTESQDWADMLYRMYVRWAEKNDLKVEVLDYQIGDEAGIKSVEIMISGHNVYGRLKSEKGVHRLVRISPFDANKRRHTSFASVEVIPSINEDVNIDIKSEDLRIDTYRASGAGGQHINKTDSAVRITHIPTGIVVTSQSQRSQIQNKEKAMLTLKSKLYTLMLEQKKEALNEIKGEQKNIEWGSQIRSYVFCPYTLVKDNRTDVSETDVRKVMDGDIDTFIYAYLKKKEA